MEVGFVSNEKTKLIDRMSWFCQDILRHGDTVYTDLSRVFGLAAAIAGLEMELRVIGAIPYTGYGLLWPGNIPFKHIVGRIDTVDVPGGPVEPYKRQTAREWVISQSDVTYSIGGVPNTTDVSARFRRYPVHVSRAQDEGIDTTADTGLPYAPTWPMVAKLKAGKITEAEYKRWYINKLSKVNKSVWKGLFAKGREEGKLTFGCRCRDGVFCHTYLLMKYLVETYPEGFQYHPNIELYMEGVEWI